PLNTLASRHYTLISKTNYFDEKGVFGGIMWGLPLLVDLFVVVVLLLRHTVSMLVTVKREQFRRERLAKEKGKGLSKKTR
ncbi:hypothetical protein HK104_006254, partial [Borealophlyctis nickersoniae]